MDNTLAQKAIGYALEGSWEDGIKINSDIIKSSPEDVDALNRLARCYSELGEISKAKKTAQKVLQIDPLNPIAKKCLEKWVALKTGEPHSQNATSPEAFLEESGKTKIAPPYTSW